MNQYCWFTSVFGLPKACRTRMLCTKNLGSPLQLMIHGWLVQQFGWALWFILDVAWLVDGHRISIRLLQLTAPSREKKGHLWLVYVHKSYFLRSLLIVLFHLDTMTKEKQPCLSSNKCNTRLFASPPMSLLETHRYWCYLLPWSLSIANRTIICEYLSFGNRTIKREWREYHLYYCLKFSSFFSFLGKILQIKLNMLFRSKKIPSSNFFSECILLWLCLMFSDWNLKYLFMPYFDWMPLLL